MCTIDGQMNEGAMVSAGQRFDEQLDPKSYHNCCHNLGEISGQLELNYMEIDAEESSENLYHDFASLASSSASFCFDSSNLVIRDVHPVL